VGHAELKKSRFSAGKFSPKTTKGRFLEQHLKKTNLFVEQIITYPKGRRPEFIYHF
jgi:hypothetical protein